MCPLPRDLVSPGQDLEGPLPARVQDPSSGQCDPYGSEAATQDGQSPFRGDSKLVERMTTLDLKARSTDDLGAPDSDEVVTLEQLAAGEAGPEEAGYASSLLERIQPAETPPTLLLVGTAYCSLRCRSFF